MKQKIKKPETENFDKFFSHLSVKFIILAQLNQGDKFIPGKFTPRWIRKGLVKRREEVIMMRNVACDYMLLDPNTKNVAAYFYMQPVNKDLNEYNLLIHKVSF